MTAERWLLSHLREVLLAWGCPWPLDRENSSGLWVWTEAPQLRHNLLFPESAANPSRRHGAGTLHSQQVQSLKPFIAATGRLSLGRRIQPASKCRRFYETQGSSLVLNHQCRGRG